mmetsp:Transcript_22645/g.57905  ORF Transcript_22645/g.57905 Transcript_22645/m.57905 type:complete len:208 (+) Transcript_22645:2092-2715(+)
MDLGRFPGVAPSKRRRVCLLAGPFRHGLRHRLWTRPLLGALPGPGLCWRPNRGHHGERRPAWAGSGSRAHERGAVWIRLLPGLDLHAHACHGGRRAAGAQRGVGAIDEDHGWVASNARRPPGRQPRRALGRGLGHGPGLLRGPAAPAGPTWRRRPSPPNPRRPLPRGLRRRWRRCRRGAGRRRQRQRHGGARGLLTSKDVVVWAATS